ncbi:MAG: phytoene desaturase family protein [Actinomycetota bacterium]|nr:phytoene desaturase family protein [Actinomycetota bacterium]
MSSGRAVVIGGGVAGLASSILLAREGYDVEVLEKNASLGGRAGTWSHEGFRFDTGPSWYLMPQVFEHFYELVGTSAAEQLDLVRLDPAYRVYYEGTLEPVDVRSDRDAAIALFEQLEPGAGPRLDDYLTSAKEVYDLAVRRFLYTTYQSLLPLLRPDVLRNAARLVSLLVRPLDRFIARSFDDNRLAQVLGYPAVFLGTSPDRAPSMYHLMSHLDLDDGVLYPRGGLTEVVQSLTRLAEAEGVRVRTNATVTRIVTEPTATPRGRRLRSLARDRRTARVRSVAWRDTAETTDTTGALQSVEADLVVGAADLHHVETRLLPSALRTYPEKWWRKKDSGPGAVLLLLGVRGELPALEHHSLFFTRDWGENFDAVLGSPSRVPDPASIYVCRPSATDTTVAPPGTENLFVLVPVPADPRLGSGGVDGAGDARVEAIADAAIAQIASWAGIPDLADRVVVRRTIGPGDFVTDVNAWSGGALGLGHTARQSAFLRGRNVSRKVAGLYYAGHSTLPGIGLPMCLISAEILLKAIRGDTSTEPLPTPLRPAAGRT